MRAACFTVLVLLGICDGVCAQERLVLGYNGGEVSGTVQIHRQNGVFHLSADVNGALTGSALHEQRRALYARALSDEGVDAKVPKAWGENGGTVVRAILRDAANRPEPVPPVVRPNAPGDSAWEPNWCWIPFLSLGC